MTPASGFRGPVSLVILVREQRRDGQDESSTEMQPERNPEQPRVVAQQLGGYEDGRRG